MVRVPTLIVVDSLVWIEAFAIAVGLRLETWQTSNTLWLAEPSGPILCMTVLVLTAIAAVLHTVLAWVLRLHQGRSALGSLEEGWSPQTKLFGAWYAGRSW